VIETEGDAQEAISDALRLSDLGIVGIRHAFDYGTVAHDDAFLARVARAANRPIIAMTAPARPIRRILVAYDGSQVSADALRSLGVLNAFDPQIVRVVTCIEGTDTDAAERHLADARGYLELHGYTVETVSLDGHPSTAILEHARAFEADVVVMGAVGRRGLSKLLAGDTASSMLATSEIPLFLRR
jgi:nucleotide-binding universal stress UspA family protein